MTLFQRSSGDEYFRIMGGWDVTASPGVTAREGMDKLVPVENWRGYCSRSNLLPVLRMAGVMPLQDISSKKMNASAKEGVNDKGNSEGLNEVLYGFKGI